jgi:hypothetical protein
VTERDCEPVSSQVSLKPQAPQGPALGVPQVVFTGLLLQLVVERLGLQV